MKWHVVIRQHTIDPSIIPVLNNMVEEPFTEELEIAWGGHDPCVSLRSISSSLQGAVATLWLLQCISIVLKNFAGQISLVWAHSSILRLESCLVDEIRIGPKGGRDHVKSGFTVLICRLSLLEFVNVKVLFTKSSHEMKDLSLINGMNTVTKIRNFSA